MLATSFVAFSQEPANLCGLHPQFTENTNLLKTIRYEASSLFEHLPALKKEMNDTFIAKGNVSKQKIRKSKGLCLDSIVSLNVKETYFYDNNGKNTLHITYRRNNSNEPWEENTKQEFTYDNQGNIIVEIHYDWENKAWKGNTKFVVTRDDNDNGDITLEIRYKWGDNKNDWIEDMKEEYAYDANRYQTMAATYFWENNKWVGLDKDGAVFDANGTQFMRLLWFWNNARHDWELIYKDTTIFTFDTNNMLIMDADYRWENNAWESTPIYKREYAYDTNGHRIRLICYRNLEYYYKDTVTYDSKGNQILGIKYSWTNNSWLFSQKIECNYDSNRHVTLDADYVWDTVKNLWLGIHRRDMAYHNDVLIMEARYGWDIINNDWLGYYKGESIYDNNENQSLQIGYNWDNINNDWKAYNKSESVFDLSYFVKDVIFPDDLYIFNKWLTTSNNNIATERKIYNWLTDDWKNTDTRRYYYSTHKTRIAEYSTTGIIVYPNPAKSQFTVTNTENATLYLYNIVGQEVFTTHSTEENTVVNVNSLPQGVYVLKVVKDGGVSVCKIVVGNYISPSR
jgi:hypothetical protein